MKWWTISILAFALLASSAQAQDWTRNPDGTGNVLTSLSSSASKTAYYFVPIAGSTDSGLLAVGGCDEIAVWVFQDSTGVASNGFVEANLMEVRTQSDGATAELSVQICVDLDGGGVDCTPMRPDDGTDRDGDGTAEQRAVIYSIRNVSVIWLDVQTAPATTSATFRVSCN